MENKIKYYEIYYDQIGNILSKYYEIIHCYKICYSKCVLFGKLFFLKTLHQFNFLGFPIWSLVWRVRNFFPTHCFLLDLPFQLQIPPFFQVIYELHIPCFFKIKFYKIGKWQNIYWLNSVEEGEFIHFFHWNERNSFGFSISGLFSFTFHSFHIPYTYGN